MATFVVRGHVVDGHVVAAAVIPEVVFLALRQLCGSFVPGHDGVVEGHLTLESGRLVLAHHDVLYALCELNWLGCSNTKGPESDCIDRKSLLP